METGAIFRVVEDFADRYENLAITGLYSHQFIVAKQKYPYFFLNNTRVYSCTLNQERSETSVRSLAGSLQRRHRPLHSRVKAGWCVVSFAAFTMHKVGATKRTKGGNTKLYEGEGRKLMAESVRAQHPDVASIKWEHGRYQHDVDYAKAARIGGDPVLKLRKGVVVPEGVNNYGMVLVNRATGKKVTL